MVKFLVRWIMAGVLLGLAGCGDVPPPPSADYPGEGESVVTGDRDNPWPNSPSPEATDPQGYESFDPPVVLSPAPEAERNPGADDSQLPGDSPSLGQLGIQLSQTLVHLPGVQRGSVFLVGRTAHVALEAPGSDTKQVEDVITANLRMAEPRIGELRFHWDGEMVHRFLEANQRLQQGAGYGEVRASLGL